VLPRRSTRVNGGSPTAGGNLRGQGHWFFAQIGHASETVATIGVGAPSRSGPYLGCVREMEVIRSIVKWSFRQCLFSLVSVGDSCADSLF
jgi:hypothetical protein